MSDNGGYLGFDLLKTLKWKISHSNVISVPKLVKNELFTDSRAIMPKVKK